MNNRQLGIFQVDRQQVIDDPDRVAGVMQMLDAVVVRCEMLYHCSAFEYMAISPQFDVIPEGNRIPEYEIEISTQEFGILESVRAIKR